MQEQIKIAFAPGTRMTYSEATKRGAKKAAQESTERSLQETLQTVVLTMQALIKAFKAKDNTSFYQVQKQECVEKDQQKSKTDRKRQKDGFKFI